MSEHFGFSKLHGSELEKYFDMISEKTLLPRDFVILYVLMARCNTSTAKIRIDAKKICEKIKIHSSSFCGSMKRLRAALIVASGKDNSGKYYMINPYLLSVGADHKRESLQEQFNSLLE
jgi:hypothetical protein